MIAILEDRKGFRKIEILPDLHAPDYKIMEFFGLNNCLEKEDDLPEPRVFRGREVTFEQYKQDYVFGEIVRWYKERKY